MVNRFTHRIVSVYPQREPTCQAGHPIPPGLQLGKNAVSVLRYSKTTVISIIKRINYSNIDNKKNKSIIMPIPGVARFPTHRIIYHLHPAEEGAQFASI